MDKPFNQACENNKHAIADALEDYLREQQMVLEIGTGTAQHAVYFGERFPSIYWQTSDLVTNHPGIMAWLNEVQLPNVLAPISVDIAAEHWTFDAQPSPSYDAIYLANVIHIIDAQLVSQLFSHLGRTLSEGGLVIMYGPFNYDGRFTSEGNRRLDEWLKSLQPSYGIRDFETVDQLARQNNLSMLDDRTMPANNRLLVWRRLP